MSAELATQFSHVGPQDTAFEGAGLRDFFVYRDLGIAGATGGKVIAQRTGAGTQGTVAARAAADHR